jgi:hypothetical protein
MIQAGCVARIEEWEMYTQNSYSASLSGRYRGSYFTRYRAHGIHEKRECLHKLGGFHQEFCSMKLKRGFS